MWWHTKLYHDNDNPSLVQVRGFLIFAVIFLLYFDICSYFCCISLQHYCNCWAITLPPLQHQNNSTMHCGIMYSLAQLAAMTIAVALLQLQQPDTVYASSFTSQDYPPMHWAYWVYCLYQTVCSVPETVSCVLMQCVLSYLPTLCRQLALLACCEPAVVRQPTV